MLFDVGVPVMVPVEVLKVSPSGSVPLMSEKLVAWVFVISGIFAANPTQAPAAAGPVIKMEQVGVVMLPPGRLIQALEDPPVSEYKVRYWIS
jgi:hypothetical protein